MSDLDIGDLRACKFCGKQPGTKVGPPALARCVTADCEGRKLGAETFEEWNARNAGSPPASEQIAWRRINAELYEYAIQQGPRGDEFVKLLDGSCLRRPYARQVPTEVPEKITDLIWSLIYADRNTQGAAPGCYRDENENRIAAWKELDAAILAFASSHPAQLTREFIIETVRKHFDQTPGWMNASMAKDWDDGAEEIAKLILAAAGKGVE